MPSFWHHSRYDERKFTFPRQANLREDAITGRPSAICPGVVRESLAFVTAEPRESTRAAGPLRSRDGRMPSLRAHWFT